MTRREAAAENHAALFRKIDPGHAVRHVQGRPGSGAVVLRWIDFRFLGVRRRFEDVRSGAPACTNWMREGPGLTDGLR